MLDLSLLPPASKILVAVSGGADSLALLLALRQANFEIVVGHVNHGLRGAESDGDEQFVRELCERENIASDARRVRCANSGEDAAREARYAALSEMARAHHCAMVATGHTADDVLETILINWLRGASIAGLAGIPPHRALDNDLVLVRPLLNATREETRELCRAAGWKWREDSTNESEIYTRNRVRLLLPQIAAAARVPVQQLARQSARAALLWREDNELLNEIAREKLALLTLEQSQDLLVLNAVRFVQLPPTLGRRVLRLAAQNLSAEAREIGSEPIELARRHIAECGRHAVWQWPGGVSVEWTGAASGNRIRVRFVSQATSQ